MKAHFIQLTHHYNKTPLLVDVDKILWLQDNNQERVVYMRDGVVGVNESLREIIERIEAVDRGGMMLWIGLVAMFAAGFLIGISWR